MNDLSRGLTFVDAMAPWIGFLHVMGKHVTKKRGRIFIVSWQ